MYHLNVHVNEFLFCMFHAVLVMRERLISSLLSEEHRMQTELKEKKRRVGDLEMALRPFLSSLVQVHGEGRVIATVGRMSSIQLSVFSLATLSLPFPLDQLSCQLTDPNSQHVECSITSTQPGMATVSYTPTLRGAHQLKITVGDTDLPGSPFTVRVLPTLEMRGVPINTIPRVSNPWGVAVSESGKVVVSERKGHCISVFSREGEKITKFGSKGSRRGQFNDVDLQGMVLLSLLTSTSSLLREWDNNFESQLCRPTSMKVQQHFMRYIPGFMNNTPGN